MLKNSKHCSKCKEIKDLLEFHKNASRKDGVQHYCKSCSKGFRLSYLRTKLGVIGQIYSHQKHHSKKRNHQPPLYTKKHLEVWLFDDWLFNLIYTNWVSCGYQSNMKPSVDRKDDFTHYTLDNIQITTWGENNNKARSDQFHGRGVTGLQCKAVLQYTIDNIFVAYYHSASQASRETGIQRTDISSCCRGERGKAGEHKWIYG